MEQLTVTLELQGRRFPFLLCKRSLLLGPAGTVSYYWMDSAPLRRSPPGPNFRACVDFWWAAIEQIGAATEIETQVNRVLAECYPLVNNARSLQDVYLDAQLAPKVEKQYPTAQWGDRSVRLAQHTFSLPNEETDRLRAMAHARDASLVRAELEGLFFGPMPTPEELPAFQEAARAWIGNGVTALRTGGSEGLSAYVGTVGQWIAKYRRRGGNNHTRMFVNLFAYESKVAFYSCFANAWIDLIPWLREHNGLDAPSERLLRLWHQQNQPGDDDTAGPGGNRDVFAGQVLSLHPLSAFVMNDPVHLQALGALISHPNYDRLVQQGEVGACSAYWDFVATILIAAHEYRHVHDRWDQTRTSPTLAESGDRAASEPRDDSPPPVATRLEEYAAARSLVCPTCAGAARFMGHEPPARGTQEIRVDFRCQACDHPFDKSISAADFEAWLRAGDD